MILPGDFFKYDMYSVTPPTFKEIKLYKKGEFVSGTVEDFEKYLYHRTLIDEAHPKIKIDFLTNYFSSYIQRKKIDSISILINDKKHVFK
jgi:hypothetical protein